MGEPTGGQMTNGERAKCFTFAYFTAWLFPIDPDMHWAQTIVVCLIAGAVFYVVSELIDRALDYAAAQRDARKGK